MQFPRQPLEKGKWIISYKYLDEVQKKLILHCGHEDAPSLEQIEMTLLSIEELEQEMNIR